MTSVAPGVYVNISAAAPSSIPGAPTGVWFVTGQTAAGPTGIPVPVASLNQYIQYFGPRVSYGSLYDSLDEFFHDGGQFAYVSRVVGPGAAVANVTVGDQGGSPQSTLTFNAVGAGTWANYTTGPPASGVQVAIASGTIANSYTISVLNNGVIVAQSGNLLTPQDAVTWTNSQSPWVALVYAVNQNSGNTAPTNNPANGTYPLSGGTDNTAGVTDTQWTAALTAFSKALGPGQVSAPGHTTTAGYEALVAHAAANNRVAFLDVTDSSNVSSLTTTASTIQQNVTDPSYAALFAPWVVIPPIAASANQSPNPPRVVPPSALAAALCAANDAFNTANTPAAGSNGASTYAIGVSTTTTGVTVPTFVQTDYATLNAAGVDAIKVVFGVVELYGFRSLSIDPNWLYLNNVRMRMQIVHDADVIGEDFVFSQIDGQGLIFSQFGGALAGLCQSYWLNGALFGATADQAFSIDTGSAVNTAATIAAGQLNAQINAVLSPEAEVVNINITKFPIGATLPA